MNFFLLWLTTIILSFGLEVANELVLFKDIVDAGYKIDIKKLSEVGKQIGPNESKSFNLSMLIPIFNIIKVLEKAAEYNNARPMLLTQLSVMDVLEEMTELEKQEYEKKPTAINAVKLNFKSQFKLMNADVIEFDDEGRIFFEVDDDFNISILKAEGSICKLTVEEQKEKIIDKLEQDMHKIIEEAIIKAWNESEQEENHLNATSSKREKQLWKDLKKELLEQKEQMNSKMATISEHEVIIDIYNENESGSFLVNVGNSLNEITILEAEGFVLELTVEEQKEKIIEILGYAVQNGIEKYCINGKIVIKVGYINMNKDKQLKLNFPNRNKKEC